MTRDEPQTTPTRVLVVGLSLAGVAAGITMLFMGMRGVMEIGGSCASGNPPYEIANPCPEGVALLTIGGIWLGIIAAGVYAWKTLGRAIPSFLGFFWPALFLSLGSNFLEYAFDPPFGGAPVWGWLIPGVMFWIMGGVPLWFVIKGRNGTATVLPPPPGMKTLTRIVTPKADLLTRMQHLDAAYQSGALDLASYEAAKHRLEAER